MVEKPLNDFQKNIYLDKESLDELITKYPGADVEKLARIQLGKVRKEAFLFEEEDAKYFHINELGESILIHNKNNANKARKAKEAVKVFEKKQQVKEFGILQPYFYDKSGLWWLWRSLECKWEKVDDIDILNMISENTNEDVISSKNRAEIINALKQE